MDNPRHRLVCWVCDYLAEVTGVAIYRFHWWWRLILRRRAAAGENGGHWRKECVAFTVARLPTMNQLSKAAYCDVVKLQGTWPSRGRQPTPARLSGPAVRQVGTTAMVEQSPKLIPSARFSPRIVIRVRPAMNHDAGMNPSARSLAVRGLNL